MTKLIVGFIAVIVVIVSLITGFFAYQNYKTPKAKIDKKEFNLILAKTDKDKQIGLSKYDKLDPGKGMLFIFEKPDYYRFWMKDMKFPIDIIFIKGNKISKISQNAQPLKTGSELTIYFANEPTDKVLEINAGLSKKYGFKIGDTVEIRNVK